MWVGYRGDGQSAAWGRRPLDALPPCTPSFVPREPKTKLVDLSRSHVLYFHGSSERGLVYWHGCAKFPWYIARVRGTAACGACRAGDGLGGGTTPIVNLSLARSRRLLRWLRMTNEDTCTSQAGRHWSFPKPKRGEKRKASLVIASLFYY